CRRRRQWRRLWAFENTPGDRGTIGLRGRDTCHSGPDCFHRRSYDLTDIPHESHAAPSRVGSSLLTSGRWVTRPATDHCKNRNRPTPYKVRRPDEACPLSDPPAASRLSRSVPFSEPGVDVIRPICLLAAALLIGACASGPASRPADAEARHSRNSLPSYSQEEAAPVEDFEYHVRVELLEDGQYRRTLTERYPLLTASPPRFYARLETAFEPDEDERPVRSATVTLPGGTAKTLDPSTIAESPAEGSSGDNLTSRRRLVAPLPSLVAGAKIERITVSHKSRPRLNVGRAFMHPLGMTLPVKSLTFVLDH